MASDESGDDAARRARAPYHLVVTRLIQARDALRELWKLENVDLGALLLLCALTVGALAWGIALRPPAGVPTPAAPRLVITIGLSGARPLGLEIYSLLTQERGSAAELSIDAYGHAGPGPRAVRWNMGVQSFTGHFCTPKRYQRLGRPLHVGGQDYVDGGTVQLPGAPGNFFVVVHLCWGKDPLLTLSNSYFSASLPRIFVPDQVGTLTDVLELRGASLYSYSPSGGPEPTGFSPRSWSWTSALSGDVGSNLTSSVIPVSGSNTAQVERDNHNTFYSGILFGIAAGAALSVIPALAVLIDRRTKGRPAPAGGSGSDTAVTANASSGEASS